MGIPFYFKSLVHRFPDILKNKLRDVSDTYNCERFYLDYNCVIHMCAAKLLANIDEQKCIDAYTFQQQVIQSSLDYIDHLCNYVKPKALLYIAIDGTCPRAKMQQQRKRRFMSVWRNEMAYKYDGTTPKNHIWDSNIVTPGTAFMRDFDEKMNIYVEQKKQAAPFEVAWSGSCEFGEGEHKIFDHIQALCCKDNSDTLDIIYGLDADLIMLSMLQQNNIMLVREVPEFNIPLASSNGPFLFLDINLLKQNVVDELLSKNSNKLDDYIMLCALVGNDFLPPLSYLKIKSDGIDILMRAYEKVTECAGDSTRHLVCRDRNELDMNVLADVIHELAIIEDECMMEADKCYYGKRPFNKNIDSYPVINKYPRSIDFTRPNWRLKYYKSLFQYENSNIVHESCTSYLQGIVWVFQYYFTKQHNLGWYYPFHYSPTCLDLYNYILTIANDEKIALVDAVVCGHNTHSQYVNAIKHSCLQLLMVLPPASANLLPLKFRPLMVDVRLGCVQYYPIKFDITTYLKTYLWECSAILPDIEIDRLVKAMQSISNE